MPVKGSTGTTRRAPLRSDRGVKLYAPTAAKPYFRVVAHGQVERTSGSVPKTSLAASEAVKFVADDLDPAYARARREADELFDRMVRWAKHQSIPVKPRDQTMSALCDRRLAELRDKGRAMTTIDQNESLMRLYVRPLIGDVEVADWSVEHSLAVLAMARRSCGAERIADLGKVLRSLVTLAHRKPLWLPGDEDPMGESSSASRPQARARAFTTCLSRSAPRPSRSTLSLSPCRRSASPRSNTSLSARRVQSPSTVRGAGCSVR